ncbi:MAG TPA: cytochrome c-type biogenesis CcmF C-terminal domain-containing protein [Pseudonocardiaceae bacterium]|jgi:cytochrome c-type biogenesis protein CcmF|nr:cytochrome c-type biogenesis CcmF C-terminal domain-containing protein [Pseudonocardiaceae bacterium]
MDQLGRFALLLAMALAAYGMVAAAIGARRRRPALVDSARRTAFALFAAIVTANGAMVVALLQNDFAIKYVAENSSLETPTFFKVLSLWAADDGSLLLWNLVLSGYMVAVALRFRRYRPVTFPYALAVLNAVQIFYLVLVNGPSRPFQTLANPPADGTGPPALLQNHPLMAVHPPFLYLGFIGFTVPFAFGIAGLLVGGGSDHWAALTRRWTLAVWVFLTVGLFLGALWSYSVLGWGGYWAWDPVENVALLPWLVSTAFLHSVMLQERRGIARLWNVVLVIGAFALTTFGTFLTRGNVLSSVHAFSQTGVGPAYLAFLALVLVVGFGLVAWRLPTLRSPAKIDSAVSREAAFVGNNVLLLVVTGIILLGTVFPLVVEAVSGRQVTVGGPYFRESLAPVFLVLLILIAGAPLLPWRVADRTRAMRRLRLPGAVAGVVVLVLALVGLRDVYAIAGFALAAAVAVGNGAEIVSGLLAARKGVDRSWWTALRNGRRRYAGLAVHVALAVVVVGITASSNFAQQTEVTLQQGHSTTFAGYTLRYDTLHSVKQPQRQILTTFVGVTDSSGAKLDPLHPSLNLYPSDSEPIGTPSIRHGVVNDLYASVIGLEQNGKSATFRFFLNPGVTWLWVGGALMVLAGIAAAWPSGRRRKPRSPASDEQKPTDNRELVETGAN